MAVPSTGWSAWCVFCCCRVSVCHGTWATTTLCPWLDRLHPVTAVCYASCLFIHNRLARMISHYRNYKRMCILQQGTELLDLIKDWQGKTNLLPVGGVLVMVLGIATLWDVMPPPSGATLYCMLCVWSRDALVCGRTCDDIPAGGWGTDEDGSWSLPGCYKNKHKCALIREKQIQYSNA